MRVSIIITVLASLIGLTLGQTCSTAPACPTGTPASVPVPWFALNFSTDPRLNAGVTSPVYSWGQQDNNADNCAQYHQGLLNLTGSTQTTLNGPGPWVNLSTATGPLSVGTTFPTYIGGVGSGNQALGTQGWTFEVTFKAPSFQNWAKVYDLGNKKPSTNGNPSDTRDCDGDIILGWSGGGPTMNFQTCVNGGSNTIGGNPQTLALNQWYHIVAVLQQSPDFRSTYTVYVNGNISTITASQQTILTQFRDQASLGRSTWNDNYFVGTYDTFNIYDVALTQAQVTSLYNSEMGGCIFTRTANVNPTLPTTAVSPFWAAEFATAVNSSTSTFGWIQQDPLDVPCNINTVHQGLITLDGTATYRPTAGPHVQLNATAGATNYAGVTVPVIGGVTAGAGTVATFSAGFAVEVTFKPWFQNYGAKLLMFGSTQNAAQSPCVQGDFWLGYASEQIGLQVYVCSGTNTNSVFNPIGGGVLPVQLMTWNHVILSFAQQPNGLATVSLWQNGNFSGISTNVYLPGAIGRSNMFLGRSQFVGGDDTYWSGEIDNVRFYNQSLNQAQVTTLANVALYGTTTPTTNVYSCPQQTNTATTVPSSAVFYSAQFNTDPRSFAGGASGANYMWLQYDTNDTSTTALSHDGLILLGSGRGAPNPGRYVNFSATSGSSTIGQAAIPQFGGFLSTGNYLAGSLGWTFELEFKALETSATPGANNGQTWAKVFDLGNGNTGSGCYNDLLWGFQGDARTMVFQTCAVNGNQQTIGGTFPQFITFGNWYHVLISLQLAPGGSIGQLFVNGTLIDRRVIPYFPLNGPRINAQLGKSSWQDQYFNGEIDMFNIYSQSINQAQASALYALSLAAAASSSSGGSVVANSTSSSSSTSTVVPPVIASSSSSTGVITARSSSSSTATVVAGGSSSSSTASTPASQSSTSSTGVAGSSLVPTSALQAVSSSGLAPTNPVSSSSSGPNSASFIAAPSMLIIAMIVIFISLMF